MGTSAVGTELSMMLSQLLDGAEIHDLHRLSGGASRETWRFTADGRALILQRQRSGDQRNMLVEAGVVGAARRGGVPVPELIDARRRDDGMAFMVLEAIDGETIARKIQRDDDFAAARPGWSPTSGTRSPRSMRSTLRASMASRPPISWRSTPTCSTRSASPTRCWSWCATGWSTPGRTSERTCVVHGDFRLGNVIVGPDGLRAVIDWELAHLGDPMEDLGWLCVKAWRFGGVPPVAGLGDYDELFRAYEEAGGERPSIRWSCTGGRCSAPGSGRSCASSRRACTSTG